MDGKRGAFFLWLGAMMAVAGCGSSDEPASAAALPEEDTGTQQDAQNAVDAGGEGAIDSGKDAPSDVSTTDASDGGQEADAGPETDASLPTQVQEDRFKQMLQALSAENMQGRLTGAPSGLVAENYVQQKMAETGLQVTVQSVPFALYEPQTPIDLSITSQPVSDAGAEAGAEAGTDAGVPTFAYQSDYRELGFSGSGSVTGQLVFVGGGTEANYQQQSVSGNIAVIMAYAPSFDTLLDRAYQHGAIGVVFIPGGDMLSYDIQDWDGVYQWSATTSYGSGEINEQLLHDTLPSVFVHSRALQRLLGKTANELESTTPYATGIEVHLEVHGNAYPQAVCHNVLAVMPGQDPALQNEAIVLSAHYDHIGVGSDGRVFYGAGDNASGTAIVLEAATALGLSGVRPKRTILFALWCGEEQGILGSFHYSDTEPTIPLEQIKLVVNVDYLGEYADPFVLGLDSTNALETSFLGNTATEGPYLIPPWDIPFQCGSDECPFHKKGIPFLHLMGQGAYYHLTGDTYEHLDTVFLKYMADVTLQGMERIAF